MEFTKKVRNLKRKLPALRHRLAEQGRRLCAVVVCASLVISGFPGSFFQALAADDYDEYEYEFDGISMLDAINAAVEDGTTLDNELLFLGDHADEYAELFKPDGTIYELKDLEPDEDAERDKDSGLRVFVRLEGDIELDEAYEVDGTEEVLFLLTNKTDTDNYIQIIVDDGETDYIQVPAAKDIHVEIDEDLAAAISAAAGGAGGAGSGIVIEPVSSGEAEDADIDEDSEVSIVEDAAEEDAEDAADADVEDAADEGSEKSADKTADDASSDSSDDADAGDTSDDKDTSSDDDSSDEGSDDKDSTGDKESSDEGSADKDSTGDKGSSDKDSSDKDSSSDKDTSDSKDDEKDSSDNNSSSHHRGSSGNRGSSRSKDSSDSASGSSSAEKADSGEKSASISINKTQILAASLTLASGSDAEEAEDASPSDASPSDASYKIEGTVYDPVRLGRWGAVAFGTTTGDLGLDKYEETLSVSYEGDDYTITVEYERDAALPEDVILTGEEYDKDSDTFIERYEEAKEFYGWEDGKEPSARLFDVTLWSGEEVVEPAAPVDVTFTFFSDDEEDNGIALLSAEAEDDEEEYADDDAEDDETGFKGRKFAITHFGEEETETVDSEVINEAGEQSISFRLESFSDIMVLAWSGNTSGKVVLNLGNGNGKYNFADYAGNKDAGTALRYTTASLTSYADDDGNVTINLPSDSNLESTFTVVDANDSQSAVTVELGKEQAYDYKLVGWVNIATGEYYDVSDGATTADIDLDNENVFYADWIAATYDHGNSADVDEQGDSLLRDDIVSTNGFVTIHMYDFNELFNLYSETLTQTETTYEGWTDGIKKDGDDLVGTLHSTVLGKGPNDEELTESFIFVNDGTTTKAEDENTGGMLSWPENKTPGDSWTGSGQPPRDAEAIWGIENPSSPPLDMLFDPEAKAVGVHYIGEADYLFWLDNGYYTYNSKEAAATYNQTEGCFYVYNGTQAVSGTSFSCFLPYNTYGSELSAFDGSVNYWFGMDMEVNFYLPSDTGKDGNKVKGEDMVFNFSGDDDILIFVDDVLVLDMSGIHDESFGSINFNKGTVKMAMSEAGLDTATPTSFSLNAGTHDLKVYYMERGGYASNLEVQFNMASLWEYETGDVQTIVAEKTWVDADGNEIDPEKLPDVYKNNGVEVGLFDVLGPAEGDTFGYTKENNVYTVEFMDDSEVTRTYVYDNSGDTPKLTYKEVSSEGTITGTDTEVDSERRVLDKDGYVVAWLETVETGEVGEDIVELLHIRMDMQTLNDANDWYYAWELLDPAGAYEVLEVSQSSSYTTTSTSENLLRYNYWSIIGDSQIEYSFENGETLQVILTEAAQEASSTLGNTKDAMGWVIVANENGISTQQIEFSQIAQLIENEDESSGQTTFKTIAGVTGQSEVDSLGSGAIWYVVDAENQTGDIAGKQVEDFHLYCVLDGKEYYLVLDGNTLTVTSNSNNAGTFCYDSLGELIVVLSDGSIERVEILSDGTITIGDAELAAATNDIRIYTLQETETSGFTFTAVNTFNPDFTLKKVDDTTNEALSDVEFTLQDEEGLYYTYDEDTGEVIWIQDPDSAIVVTDEDGIYTFHYLPDGSYILTETKAKDGYLLLISPITIEISNGVIITAEFETESESNPDITISNDGLTITVGNLSGGSELPRAGGPGTMLFTLTGVLLMSGSVLLYLKWKRRRLQIKT